jgi:Holliday junction resolvasome RuvABC endonuclease subunit
VISLILGVDGGLATCGLALAAIRNDGSLDLLKVATVRTTKSAAKRGVYASDDNVRRCRELATELHYFVCNYPGTLSLICAEAMSFPRSSSTAAKMGMGWGVLAAFAHELEVPIVQASPQQIKLALCGKKTASKSEVQAAIEDRWSHVQWPKRKADVEHAADAAAAIVACEQSNEMRILASAGGRAVGEVAARRLTL